QHSAFRIHHFPKGRETARIPRCHPHCPVGQTFLSVVSDHFSGTLVPAPGYGGVGRRALVSSGEDPVHARGYLKKTSSNSRLGGVFGCVSGAGLPPSPALYG